MMQRRRLASWSDRMIQAVRRRRVTIAITFAVAVVASIVISLTIGAQHRATASLLLAAPGQRAAGGDDLVATIGDVLRLRTVAEDAAGSVPGTSADEIADRIEVRSSSPSNVIHVDATTSSAESATRTANAYAEAYLSFVRANPSPALPARAELVEQARGAEKVSSPPLARGAAIGLLAGLLLAAALVWLRERFDQKVRSIEELAEIYELPVMARIPRSRALSVEGRAVDSATAAGFSEEAEAFRTLRANLRYFGGDDPVRSILLASPLPGDGKSTVARHLAVTMAAMGDSVCLVDADLRKQDPVTGSNTDGLSLVLAGFDLEEALTESPVAFDPISEELRTLVELASGPLPPSPSELLESGRMRWLIGELERRFDIVVIDSPALVTVSDALSLVPEVSGVLVVGGIQQTVRQAALDLRQQVGLLGGRPLGVVANFCGRRPSYYQGHYSDDRDGRALAR